MERITIGPIDRNWEAIASNYYYAQRGAADEFAFGRTTSEALANLEKREATLTSFDLELAEEIAFLALGAADFLQDHKGHDLSEFGGYMGFISEVIRQSTILLHRWRQIPKDEFSGVWLYDVTERFGREWAEVLLEGKTKDPAQLLEYVITNEMQKWELCKRL